MLEQLPNAVAETEEIDVPGGPMPIRLMHSITGKRETLKFMSASSEVNSVNISLGTNALA